MKRIILIAIVTVFTAFTMEAQAQKIAFVKTSQVIDTLPLKDSAEAKLAEYAAMYEEQLKSLELEIQSVQAQYEKESKTAGVSQTRLELIQGKYQKLVQQYQETQGAMEQDLQMQRATLLKPIVDQIKEAIATVAKQKGFTQVLDNSSDMVMYLGNPADDITDAVIKHMLANPAKK